MSMRPNASLAWPARSLHGFAARDVRLHDEALASAPFDLLLERFKPVLAPCRQHHGGSFFCQRPRGGIADSAGSARYDGDLIS